MYKPRILMMLDSMASGGTETYVFSVASSLQKSGAHVVICGNGGIMHPVFQNKFPTYLISVPWGSPPNEEQADQLRSILDAEQINVVHVHQTPSGLLAAQAAKATGIPVVFTVHGTYYPVNELVTLSQQVSSVISVSKPVHAYLQTLGISSEVISNGVDVNHFTSRSDPQTLRERLGISPDALIVLYVSRLAWQKGRVCKLLLRAARDLRQSAYANLEVVVVGGGPELKEIEQLSVQLEQSLKQRFIHIEGHRSDLPHYYRLSDCVVGTGRVALEAMACAKPVLAVGNHGFFGWVEPSNYEQAWNCYFGDHQSVRSSTLPVITEALRKGLAKPSRLRHIGEQNRGWIERSFNAEHVSQKISKLYQNVLSCKEVN